MASDKEIDEAVRVYEAEYRRVFPAGGDAQDHDEAVNSAVAAVLESAMTRIGVLKTALRDVEELSQEMDIQDLAREALADKRPSPSVPANESVGARILRQRLSMGLTQEEMASRSGRLYQASLLDAVEKCLPQCRFTPDQLADVERQLGLKPYDGGNDGSDRDTSGHAGAGGPVSADRPSARHDDGSGEGSGPEESLAVGDADGPQGVPGAGPAGGHDARLELPAAAVAASESADGDLIAAEGTIHFRYATTREEWEDGACWDRAADAIEALPGYFGAGGGSVLIKDIEEIEGSPLYRYIRSVDGAEGVVPGEKVSPGVVLPPETDERLKAALSELKRLHKIRDEFGEPADLAAERDELRAELDERAIAHVREFDRANDAEARAEKAQQELAQAKRDFSEMRDKFNVAMDRAEQRKAKLADVTETCADQSRLYHGALERANELDSRLLRLLSDEAVERLAEVCQQTPPNGHIPSRWYACEVGKVLRAVVSATSKDSAGSLYQDESLVKDAAAEDFDLHKHLRDLYDSPHDPLGRFWVEIDPAPGTELRWRVRLFDLEGDNMAGTIARDLEAQIAGRLGVIRVRSGAPMSPEGSVVASPDGAETDEVDPLSVDCPLCGIFAGGRCVTWPKGRPEDLHSREPHDERVKLATSLAADAASSSLSPAASPDTATKIEPPGLRRAAKALLDGLETEFYGDLDEILPRERAALKAALHLDLHPRRIEHCPDCEREQDRLLAPSTPPSSGGEAEAHKPGEARSGNGIQVLTEQPGKDDKAGKPAIGGVEEGSA